MKTENYKLIQELRHELHSHPELSNQEVWTKKRLMDFLHEHTSLEIHDGGKWFWAVRRAGDDKMNIAFRADFDALPIQEQCDVPYKSKFPGISHKCGHDGHSAALCGLGLELEDMKPDKNVFLLFQHAEETGNGALDALGFITENNIDCIYAFHNMPGYKTGTVAVRSGPSNCASKGMIIEMAGTPTHASQPELGNNPIFPLANVVSAIPKLSAPERYTGIVLCTVIQLDAGERVFGTAASRGKLLLTLRAEHEKELDSLQADIERLCLVQAEQYGVECSFFYVEEFPETTNDISCAEKVLAAADALGYPVVKKKDVMRGSEDFGRYLKLTPGALFFIGGGEDVPPFHTVYYDFTDSVMDYAVEMFKKLIEF